MSRSRYFALLFLFLAIAVFGLVYPFYVIRPFRPQGAAELRAALWILRYRGLPEALLAGAALVTLILGWRGQRGRATKMAGLVVTVLVFASAILSRVNIYEIMFHPIGRPSFGAAWATKLDGAERVV